MTIRPNTRISQLQKEFNAEFPYLKLEFFKHHHEVHDSSPKKDMLKTDFLLKPTKKNLKEGVEIHGDMAVSTVEQLFRDLFGVSAQIFRKSGRSWLVTSLTDDWTLKRQNQEGLELSEIKG